MKVTRIDWKAEWMCQHHDCRANYDPKKFPKPPPGWATIVVHRYGKKEHSDDRTFLVCPKHTIEFCERQPQLRLKGPSTKTE